MSKMGFIISIIALLAVLGLGIALLFSGNKKGVVNAPNQPAITTENPAVKNPAPTPADKEQAPAKVQAPENAKPATDTSGFKIEVLKEGTGTRVTKDGDGISVNYTGTLIDGTKFDSSYDRNQPFKFDLGMGEVIKGWDQGLIGMKVGEIRKLTVPPSLGYGSQAMGDKIPANSTLIFQVELLSIL